MKKQKRVVIDGVWPQLNNGEFYIKRVVNYTVHVGADVLVDGHDVIAAALLFKHEHSKTWDELRMFTHHSNYYEATFEVKKQGTYSYKVVGWVDYALNWQHGISRKIEDSQHVNSELLEGIYFLKKCMLKANATEKKYLKELLGLFRRTFHR